MRQQAGVGERIERIAGNGLGKRIERITKDSLDLDFSPDYRLQRAFRAIADADAYAH